MLIQLAIVQNPFTDNPKDLIDSLISESDVLDQECLDKNAMDNLKSLLGKDSLIMVK